MNYLALIGWSPRSSKFKSQSSPVEGEPAAEELLPALELARRFRLEDVSHSAGVFDEAKLSWVNRHYLKALAPARLIEEALPFLRQAGIVVGRSHRRRAGLAGDGPAAGRGVGRSPERGARPAPQHLSLRCGSGARRLPDWRPSSAEPAARAVVLALAEDLDVGAAARGPRRVPGRRRTGEGADRAEGPGAVPSDPRGADGRWPKVPSSTCSSRRSTGRPRLPSPKRPGRPSSAAALRRAADRGADSHTRPDGLQAHAACSRRRMRAIPASRSVVRRSVHAPLGSPRHARLCHPDRDPRRRRSPGASRRGSGHRRHRPGRDVDVGRDLARWAHARHRPAGWYLDRAGRRRRGEAGHGHLRGRAAADLVAGRQVDHLLQLQGRRLRPVEHRAGRLGPASAHLGSLRRSRAGLVARRHPRRVLVGSRQPARQRLQHLAARHTYR